MTLPSRGWGPFRQEWYSYSSSTDTTKTGPETGFGSWVNVWGHRGSSLLYRLSPKLWRVWANRKYFNPGARRLERTFPKLKMR
jgi:hypothetical protein